MQRRQFHQTTTQAIVGLLLGSTYQYAQALSLGDLTSADATLGVKTALEKGAMAAVFLLGQQDGFLNNPKVHISLPGYLQSAGSMLKMMGMGQQIQTLETSMNRAAEAAVPKAKTMLVSAVKSMNVNDAKNILSGGDTSVTQFFADKTRSPLNTEFLPVVTASVAQVGLAQQYNDLAGRIASLGLMRPQDASIEQYVTGKSLDGLYLMIGEEEKKIRQDPIGTGSQILGKVFGVFR